MSTLPDIQRAIRELTTQELAQLRQWFAEYDAANWDRQIEQDVAAGKLDALADEALTDLRQGRCKNL